MSQSIHLHTLNNDQTQRSGQDGKRAIAKAEKIENERTQSILMLTSVAGTVVGMCVGVALGIIFDSYWCIIPGMIIGGGLGFLVGKLIVHLTKSPLPLSTETIGLLTNPQ